MKTERYASGETLTTEPQRHNDGYERTIISVCLSATFADRDAMVYAIKNLRPEYFYNPTYADCFRAIVDMMNGAHGVPVAVPDVLTFTGYVGANAERYETFRRMKETDPTQIQTFVIDIAMTDPTLNGRYIVADIIEMYKARRRWEIGVKMQNLAGEIDDTAAKRQKLYDELAALELLGVERYDDYFTPSTLANDAAALRDQGTGLNTGYTLGKEHNGKIIKRDFKIPPKQITIIAAATGHGKSTFCYNLALRMIERNKRPDGTPVKVLYLSYEESKHNIAPKIINVMVGMNLADDNRAAIAADLANGGTGAFINNPHLRAEYCAAVRKFYEWAAAGTLTVKYCDLDTAELCGLIREFRKRDAADVVIIDYIQLQEKESSKAHGRNRPDELKEIVADLRKLANDEILGLSVILASQFNRTVQSGNDPRLMDKTAIGESANIEHAANVILGLWNCQETNAERYHKTEKDGTMTNELTADGERLLKYLHINNINDPFIYARLLKSRDGINGLNMTLNYYGNCGRIENTTDPTPNEKAGMERDETTEPRSALNPDLTGAKTSTAAPSGKEQKQERRSIFDNDDLPF